MRPLALLALLSIAPIWFLCAAAPAMAAEPLAARLAAGCAWLDSGDAREAGKDRVLGDILQALRDQCRTDLPASEAADWAPTAAHAALVDELEALRAGLTDTIETPPPAGPPPSADKGQAAKTQPEPADQPKPIDLSAPLSGTWHMPPQKTIDAFVKRRLELTQDGKRVVGRMFEETWFKAPTAWVDTSCGGKSVFRMVTAAPVSGTIEGDAVTFRRERPAIVSCTCGARCIPEKRRRGFAFELVEAGNALRDGDTIFVREGAKMRGLEAGGPAPGAANGTVGARGDMSGDWESEPYSRGGANVVTQLALSITDKRVTGTLSERVSQPLPLESWRDRFCAGAERFEYVEAFDVDGTSSDGGLALRFKAGRVLSCSCPSKCLTPKRRGLSLSVSPAGTALEGSGLVLRRP
jgi:hypothetical protein